MLGASAGCRLVKSAAYVGFPVTDTTAIPPTTAARMAKMVTAFWPGVKPWANRRNPSRARVRSVKELLAISELQVHDVGERRDGPVGEGDGDLGGQRGLGRRDQGVGHAALPCCRQRLGLRGRVLGLLDLVEGAGDVVREAGPAGGADTGARRQWLDGGDGRYGGNGGDHH